MSFGRWLLVHSFSIFLVGLLVLGYFFRGELQLQQVYDQILDLRPPVNLTAKDETGSEDPVQKTDSQVIGQQTAEANSQAPEFEQATLPSRQQPTLPEPTPTVAESHYIDADLSLARKAYWDRRYDESVNRYRRMIEREPGNVDYLGELGNVYYTLNDYQQAANAYYRAALLLIEQQETMRARQLLSPIIAMDRNLGEQLQKKLSIN